MFDYKKNKFWAENLQIVSQIGLTMVGCILLCFFIGHKADQFFNVKGIFTTIFIIFGVLGGGYTVYRQIMEITSDKENKTDNP